MSQSPAPAARAFLSVIIPCAGTRMNGLARLVDSLALQGRDAADVEIVVVGDTLDGPLPHVERFCAERATCVGGGLRYVGHAGEEHAWGQPQRQAGIDHARGFWLWWLADDDIAALGSLRALKAAIRRQPRRRPLLFQFQAPWRQVVWTRARTNLDGSPILMEGNIDASGIVVPNVPERLGVWQNRYAGDFDFAAHTAALWSGDIGWEETVVCIARPTEADDWTRFDRRARETGEPLRLNLGCGAFQLPGWLNLDSSPNVLADLYTDVAALALPFSDGAVEEIYAGHLLEHLPRETVPAFLAECQRALKPGGRLGLVVPDTREVMRRYVAGETSMVQWPAGHWRDLGDLDEACGMLIFSTEQESPHRWAYDLTTLRRALVAAGFEIGPEIDRHDDPRIPVGAWYQCGTDAFKPAPVLSFHGYEAAAPDVAAPERELVGVA